MRKALFAGAGGVVAAFLGSLCCVGPLVFVTLGVGAGVASTFEPLRPIFGVLMATFLAAGFYTVYGKRSSSAEKAGSGGEACAVSRDRRHDKLLLWTAAAIALALWTFPAWSGLFV